MACQLPSSLRRLQATPLLQTSLPRTQIITYSFARCLIKLVMRPQNYLDHDIYWAFQDLKPSNIAVNEDCELRILDFGLARPTENEMTGKEIPEIYLFCLYLGILALLIYLQRQG